MRGGKPGEFPDFDASVIPGERIEMKLVLITILI